MTLKRLVKITHGIKREFDSHCLTKRVELFYFMPLKTGFVENKGQSGPLQLSLNSKADISCQLNFRLFVSCLLTPSRPSVKL